MSDLPDSYGDTTAEYLAGRSAGLVEGLRSLFWVEGPDAISFLQGIVTQDVEAMLPGQVSRSMLLEPRGKLVSLMWLLRDEEKVGVLVDHPMAEATFEALAGWRFRVEVELRFDPRPILEIWGSEARATVAHKVTAIPDGWEERDSQLIIDASLESLDRILLAGLDAEAFIEAGAKRIGAVAAETIRLETGEPLMGRDVDQNTIPQESGLVDVSVSFSKGCYLGQELVARIDTRGRVNRRLAGLKLQDNVVPPVGAIVVGVDRELGRITSVGESLELRAPIAMGLIRREAPPGTVVSLEWDGGKASALVVDLPMVGAQEDG